MKIKAAAAVVLSVTLLGAGLDSSVCSGAQRTPGFVRFALAGSDVRNGGRSVHDARAGYKLVYAADCGDSHSLILTPDKLPPSVSAETVIDWQGPGNTDGVRKGTLSRLRTGSGVNIGDAPAVVQRKLGAGPHEITNHGSVSISVWNYYAVVEARVGKRSERRNYRAQYTFYNNKLWSISYNMHGLTPCGG